jgi:hypothetical protein
MKVNVKMLIEVTTTIDSKELDTFADRVVDVYLHGEGENGHLNKHDIGGTMIKFEVLTKS